MTDSEKPGLVRPGHQWDAHDDYYGAELRRATRQHGPATVREAILAQVVARVRHRFPDVAEPDLAALAAAAYERLQAGPITAYLPNLIEHSVRASLNDRIASSDEKS